MLLCRRLARSSLARSSWMTIRTGLLSRDAATYSNILVDDQGPVRVVQINRPERRNCVDRHTAKELHHAFSEFDRDESALVGVLAGREGCFCAGYDLKELAGSQQGKELDEFKMGGIAPMGLSWLHLSKPVIGAISGYAVAGGLELALWCDMRVADEGAKMGVFCRRFGVPLLDGGSIRLPRLIGLSRALDLILTGREVLAQEAHQMGLINRVVPSGLCLSEAIKLANHIASFPQECMRADRQSAHRYTSCDMSCDPSGIEKALEGEYRTGRTVLNQAVTGAQRFVSGIGRGGKFEN